MTVASGELQRRVMTQVLGWGLPRHPGRIAQWHFSAVAGYASLRHPPSGSVDQCMTI